MRITPKQVQIKIPTECIKEHYNCIKIELLLCNSCNEMGGMNSDRMNSDRFTGNNNNDDRLCMDSDRLCMDSDTVNSYTANTHKSTDNNHGLYRNDTFIQISTNYSLHKTLTLIHKSIFNPIKKNKIFTVRKCMNVVEFKFNLITILCIKEFMQILEDYKCVIDYRSNNYNGNSITEYNTNSIIEIIGKDLQSVNECVRKISELYYSGILLEIDSDSSLDWKNVIEMKEGGKVYIYGTQSIIEANMINNDNGIDNGSTDSNTTIPVSHNTPSITTLNTALNTALNTTTVKLEVDQETGNFICGKKMGKIFKIDTKILKILHKSEITIFEMNGSIHECIKCYSQLLNEFPSEICFNVDRKLHKKIIGVEGMGIQKIMKKYNFYVKFLNLKEVVELELEGNVILRTPKKNKANLIEAKKEICDKTLRLCCDEISSMRKHRMSDNVDNSNYNINDGDNVDNNKNQTGNQIINNKNQTGNQIINNKNCHINEFMRIHKSGFEGIKSIIELCQIKRTHA